ncbi:HNH endonuclease signature motif containing protein [Phenylobacterium sp.]|jgi:hypothetical protein|uniref:HNH endonuclease signature motif containing protein n=1 Tax=Phenylobacterium sp. TaxID=1871053 RepID=UPI003782E925
MARRPIDPARLNGEALTRWYLRSPAEIQRERDQAEADSWHDYQLETRRQLEADPGPRNTVTPASAQDDLYIATGSGGWRRIGGDPLRAQEGDPSFRPAEPEQGAFVSVGNRPSSPTQIKQWEKREGRPWPRDPVTGRLYEVGHIRALADGGTDTLDNIEPIHPDAHRAQHKANGDYSRWARRRWIANAFGGRVARALGPLGILPNITGVLSGRIRTDSFDNYTSDIMGWPSDEDRRRQLEREQKATNPNWKAGDPIVI